MQLPKLSVVVQLLQIEGWSGLFRAGKQWAKRRFGPYRPDESAIAFQVLEGSSTPGCMLDVGAHYGGALAPFARADWQIFAFEPDSANRRKLKQNFGDFDNIQIDARALSDQPREKMTLFRSAQSTGISGLSSFHESHQPGEEVAVTTLALFLEEQGLQTTSIDFLKIDTEGFDLPVLKGVPWSDQAPRMILCEFEDGKTLPLGYNFHDLAEYLVEKGYRLVVSEWYPIQAYGQQHDWRRFTTYPCTLQDPKAWGNILAVREEVLYERLLTACKLV